MSIGFFIFTLVRMSSLLGDIYEESLARVILWNFVFVLAKLKDLCVLDIIYVIYMRRILSCLNGDKRVHNFSLLAS